ncbi:MAG: class I SAM-dependent methyltransferase [Thermoplasmata archaeon]|nr:class I SAM-dependent methyltransferase [Thermoplasmata archaeon]
MTDPERIDGFGAWYDEKQGDSGDLWHRTLIDPGLFARIGPVPRGIRVLDLGCGNGYIARRLARLGARVVGVDTSPELIERARAWQGTEPLDIVYHRADAAHLSFLSDQSIDLAVANMSLVDIENASGTIRETARVVVPGGRFVFSISHPCFDVDTRSGWLVEVTVGPPTVFRKVARYQEPHSDSYRWALPDGRSVRTVGYHRPLAWYVKQLRTAGFIVVDAEEPGPSIEFVGHRMKREWIEQIPLHLVIEARREPAQGTPG